MAKKVHCWLLGDNSQYKTLEISECVMQASVETDLLEALSTGVDIRRAKSVIITCSIRKRKESAKTGIFIADRHFPAVLL